MGSPQDTKLDTARNSATVTDWERVAALSEFKDLMAAKVRFIAPATLFFIVYYFALPVLVGYAPELMSKPIIGPVNIAYLFALSQFLVAWGIAFLYMRVAGRFDDRAKSILDGLARQKNAGNGGQ